MLSPGMLEEVISGSRNGGRAYLASSCKEEVYDPTTYDKKSEFYPHTARLPPRSWVFVAVPAPNTAPTSSPSALDIPHISRTPP